MKNLFVFALLWGFFTTFIFCKPTKDITIEIDETKVKTEVLPEKKPQPTIIDKIKHGSEVFIQKVKEDTEKVIQDVKTGYKEVKCKLHQVGEKILKHSHQINPCIKDNNQPGETIVNNENFESYSNGRKIVGDSTDQKDNYPAIDPRVGEGSNNADEKNGKNLVVPPVDGKRLFAPIRCPPNYSADINGICRERY